MPKLLRALLIAGLAVTFAGGTLAVSTPYAQAQTEKEPKKAPKKAPKPAPKTKAKEEPKKDE